MYNTLIAVLTAVTIVLGMRMMGALLITSLIIFPALTSMRVCRTFKSVIINSAVISAVCLVIGITVSYVWATPAGASVVMANIAALLVYSIAGMLRSLRRSERWFIRDGTLAAIEEKGAAYDSSGIRSSGRYGCSRNILFSE